MLQWLICSVLNQIFQPCKSGFCEGNKNNWVLGWVFFFCFLLLLIVNMNVPWLCPGMEVIASSSSSVPYIIIKRLMLHFCNKNASRKVGFLQSCWCHVLSSGYRSQPASLLWLCSSLSCAVDCPDASKKNVVTFSSCSYPLEWCECCSFIPFKNI